MVLSLEGGYTNQIKYHNSKFKPCGIILNLNPVFHQQSESKLHSIFLHTCHPSPAKPVNLSHHS